MYVAQPGRSLVNVTVVIVPVHSPLYWREPAFEQFGGNS